MKKPKIPKTKSRKRKGPVQVKSKSRANVAPVSKPQKVWRCQGTCGGTFPEFYTWCPRCEGELQ